MDRYNRKPLLDPPRNAVLAVLQDEALDELTASFLVTALGSTGELWASLHGSTHLRARALV